MKSEENEVYGAYDGELKITIKDGDYTLREGVDYETYCIDGNRKPVDWLLFTIGEGKYEKMIFIQTKWAVTPEAFAETRWDKIQSLLDLIQEKKNDVSY